MKRTHTILVLGDAHVPYHDPDAVARAVEIVAQRPWTSVHLLGDWMDAYAVSSHLKDVDLIGSLQAEIDALTPILKTIRSACSKARITYHEGNHENRLQRYLARSAPELAGLRSVRLPTLLNLDDLHFDYRPYTRPIIECGILFTHGHLCRAGAGTTARAMLALTGRSTVIGHTHRLAVVHQTIGGRAAFAAENGCLCRLTPTPSNAYTRGFPDWQQGVTWIEARRRGPRGWESEIRQDNFTRRR